MAIHESIDTLRVAVVQALGQDLKTNPEEWENHTLERYLERLAAWLEGSAGHYGNGGLAEPSSPSWKDVAGMICAAKIYD